MNNNIIRFYMLANKLKNEIRTGWTELGIKAARLESIAEHIYGELVLAIAIDSEIKFDIDMLKVFKMLILKEFSKIDGKEYTTTAHLSEEEKANIAITNVAKITSNLVKKDEYFELLNELKDLDSDEAKFAYQISKVEADLQTKIYDLNGDFDLDKAIEDAKNYPEQLKTEIVPQIKNASDGFILYDRTLLLDDLFKSLSYDIANLTDDD